MTLAEFIAAHTLGFTCERVSPRLWRCRITCGVTKEAERGMSFFHLSSTEPTLADALSRLAKVSHQHVATKLPTGLAASRDKASFQHWCVLYDHDPESRKDRAHYLTIRRRAEQLRYVLGTAAFKQLLEVA